MSQINDGGPAFPTPSGHARMNYQHPNGDYQRTVEVCMSGMTIRDWFASMAASAMAARWLNDDEVDDWPAIAADCYKYADAMLAAREVR